MQARTGNSSPSGGGCHPSYPEAFVSLLCWALLIGLDLGRAWETRRNEASPCVAGELLLPWNERKGLEACDGRRGEIFRDKGFNCLHQV